MIINDDKRFVFVHIPKCAGTSVRVHLVDFDTTGGAFSASDGVVPGIGRVDLAHLPLGLLREHFPDVFAKVRDYETFAILRDPFKRFSSSLFQRLSMYGGGDARSASSEQLVATVDAAIGVLEGFGPDAVLPYDFIHFQPQVSYIDLDGTRVVGHVYDIDDLAAFFTAVDAQLGGVFADPAALTGKRAGAASFYRSPAVRGVAGLLGPRTVMRLAGAVPESLKRPLRRMVFESKADRFIEIIASERVTGFIREFYARDITLYDAVRGAGSA